VGLRAGRLSGAGVVRAEGMAANGGQAMEASLNRVDFPRESVLEIRGTRFVVAAFFDEAREPLKTKVARLLQENIENQGLHI